MAKKVYDNTEMVEEVNEVLDKAVVNEESVLPKESLVIDTEKLSKELDEMKAEIFDEKPKKEVVKKEEKIEVKKEEVKPTKKEEVKEVSKKKEAENKKLVNRLFGLIWNGQEFDY